MTEDEARAWLSNRNVPRETLAALERFAGFLIKEGHHQNLISTSSMDALWSRHIVDSAQLLDLAPAWTSWIDLGSGAGFPGLVIAALTEGRVTLVESRAKRVTFLQQAVELLGVSLRTEVIGGRIEMVPPRCFDIISARAFAPLDRLLTQAAKFAGPDTQWILPKGKSASLEVDTAQRTWQGNFNLVQSITDSEAAIVVATGVTRGKRR